MTPSGTQALALNVAEHAEGPGMLWVQADGAGQVRDRLLIPAHQPVRLTALGQGPGMPRVQADRTGQVREAAPYNSDGNQELAPFVSQIALQYKFKPLLVDGAARQMEMPLVLHFTTTSGEPIPELDDAQTRKLITGCDLPHKVSDPASTGQQIEIIFKVHENGHMETVGSSDRKIPVLSLFREFQNCKFGIYSSNGKPTPYHAHLSVKAQ